MMTSVVLGLGRIKDTSRTQSEWSNATKFATLQTEIMCCEERSATRVTDIMTVEVLPRATRNDTS